MTAALATHRLRVVLILKTGTGGLWTLPHIDELSRRGHEVAVVIPAGPGPLRDELARRDVRIVDSPFPFRFRPGPRALLGLLRLRARLRELAPNVIHYHLYASALASRLASIGMRVPRVHMVAGPLYLDSPVIRRCERVLSRMDSVVIGGSEHTSARYRTLGLAAARTPTIPYGVDTSAFQPPTAAGREAARASLGVVPDTLVVIMTAYVYAPKRAVHRGRGIKGHDVLLDAWRWFRDRHRDAVLLLVGAGLDERGERHRQELIDRYGVADDPRIVWLSSVTDVRGYYAAADVSVSPSLSENHGAVLEAGAMGVPSIVSDAGALPETVDERCGWVVPRDDAAALGRALALAYGEFRRGTLRERGRRARERTVRRFDRRAAAARVADVIEQAAPPRAAPPRAAPPRAAPPRAEPPPPAGAPEPAARPAGFGQESR